MLYTKGHRGKRRTNYKVAHQSMIHALRYATDHRRERRRDFRRLWIIRINAAARENGLTYGRLINGLSLAGIVLDRKSLSELAITDAATFTIICDQARNALESKAA
jgi:large subunit ribosomal protein L20